MKRDKRHWQFLLMGCILMSSRFCVCMADGADGALTLRLQEVKLALQTEKSRTEKLKTERQLLQRKLEALRTRYADLYLKSREKVDQKEDEHLAIAHLLEERKDISSGMALSQVIRAMEDTQKGQRQLLTAIREYEVYLDSVLDILKPSDALRREVSARTAALSRMGETTLTPLPSVAGRGSRKNAMRRCRVLDVNEELQIVVLDAGYDDGLRAGTRWNVLRDTKVVAQIELLEVRRRISAAMPLKGGLKAILPGQQVVPSRDGDK
ncbi:MAG: hypothetical protein KAI66_10450 [Lentisphaeria bacterium]|nr:hypothetical protein [Lentisphaeria bacterium]